MSINFKKKKEEERKKRKTKQKQNKTKRKQCVAQQRFNLTKKEGIFKVFCQTN